MLLHNQRLMQKMVRKWQKIVQNCYVKVFELSFHNKPMIFFCFIRLKKLLTVLKSCTYIHKYIPTIKKKWCKCRYQSIDISLIIQKLQPSLSKMSVRLCNNCRLFFMPYFLPIQILFFTSVCIQYSNIKSRNLPIQRQKFNE